MLLLVYIDDILILSADIERIAYAKKLLATFAHVQPF